MIKKITFLLATALPAQASDTFNCVELERVSLASSGSMRPVYEGRTLTFTKDEGIILGDGVFYHEAYEITALGEDGFRAFAEDADRSDLFRFEDGILLHAAIVKYGREPAIQSQVFRCEKG